VIEILNNHRGPYRLMVTRPFVTKPGFFRSEWLTGEIDRDDVESEARALLGDPRDTIHSVHIWSVREQQFVGSLKEKGSRT
jgi:hypothetical protein